MPGSHNNEVNTAPSSGVHNLVKTHCRDFKLCTNLDKHFINNVWKNHVITLDHFWMRLNLLEYTFLGDTRYNHYLAHLAQNYQSFWKFMVDTKEEGSKGSTSLRLTNIRVFMYPELEEIHKTGEGRGWLWGAKQMLGCAISFGIATYKIK